MRVFKPVHLGLFLLAILAAPQTGAAGDLSLQPLMIPTPTKCEIFDRFEPPNKVILTRPDSCQEHNGFIQAQVPFNLENVNIYLDQKFLESRPVPKYEMEPLRQVVRDKQQHEKELKDKNFAVKPLGEQNDRAKKIVTDLSSRFYSNEYQDRIKKEQERIEREIFPENVKQIIADTKQPLKDSGINQILAGDERIYFFISKSIPVGVLRDYMKSFDKVSDPQVFVVLRGMVGGAKKIKPTMEFFKTIVEKDPTCKPIPSEDSQDCPSYRVNLIVDPLLYRRFDVQTVPTLVFARGVTHFTEDKDGSEGNAEKAQIRNAWSISGDTNTPYLLEKINTEAQSQTLAAYIDKMTQGFYQ